MCHPAVPAVIMMAAAAASTAVSIRSQNKNAEAIAEAANLDAGAKYAALAEQMTQVNDKAGLDKFERMRQAMRETATARVSGGESGLTGVSNLRILRDSMFQGSYDVSIIERNRQNAVKQNSRDMKSVYAEAQGRINTAKAGTTKPGVAALQIGLSGVQGATAGYTSGLQMGLGSTSPAAGGTGVDKAVDAVRRTK